MSIVAYLIGSIHTKTSFMLQARSFNEMWFFDVKSIVSSSRLMTACNAISVALLADVISRVWFAVYLICLSRTAVLTISQTTPRFCHFPDTLNGRNTLSDLILPISLRQCKTVSVASFSCAQRERLYNGSIVVTNFFGTFAGSIFPQTSDVEQKDMWNLEVGFEKCIIVSMHFSLMALFSRYGVRGLVSNSVEPRQAAIIMMSISSMLQRLCNALPNIFWPSSVARSQPRDLSSTIGFMPLLQSASQRFVPRNPLPPSTTTSFCMKNPHLYR